MKSNNKKFDQLEGAWAAAGFSVVLIIVGLPVWWLTTTVYRAGLPYSAIDDLSSKDIYHTLHIAIITDQLSRFNNAGDNLKSRSSRIKFLTKVQHPDINEEEAIRSSESIEALDKRLRYLKTYPAGTLSIYFLNSNTTLLSSEILISRRRVLFVDNNIDFIYLSKIINSLSLDLPSELLLNKQHKLNSSEIIQEKEENISNKDYVKIKKYQVMRQVPTEPAYDVTLTLMLPQPHLLIAKWNVSQAVEDYLEPFVNQLKTIAEFRVRSQILYMTSMRINPRWSSKYKHYSLPEQQLPLTINAIESKLGSFVSTRPSLHFIVYVPSDVQAPLKIHTRNGEPLDSNSFLVPRWGGILIHNPPEELISTKNKTYPQSFEIDSHWVMSTVICHLLKLFPIPTLGNVEIVKSVEESDNVLMDWQVDGLSRTRISLYLNNIKITLQSLCDLVGEIGNMVVSDEVAGWVWAAVSDWEQCLQASREGRLEEATQFCKEAFVYSDAAFFHPSMLALLYFPDNQKYAIYVPLFLPVSIPVVLSLKTIFKLIHSKKAKED